MKKLSLIMALLLVFASVSAMAEDTTAESVFDYRVDFQTLSSYPEDGILSSNVYNYMSNGACYQKIGSSDGAGWGHSVAVGGMNSDITYAEAKVNAVWSAGFKIGFVPVGKSEATEFIYFEPDMTSTSTNVTDEDGRLLATYSRAKNNSWTIGMYTDSANDISHVYFGGKVIAANLDCPENISTISYKWSDLSGDDLRVSLDNMVVTQTEKSFGSDFGIGDVYFEENDTEITAHADVVNYTSSPFTASFVIASYNGNTLENVNVVPVSAPEKDITDVFVNLEKPSGSDTTVKAMLVSDMSTLKPLVKAATK